MDAPRFHVKRNEIPYSATKCINFERRAHWYNLPLFCNEDDATHEVSYGTQYSAIKAALRLAGIGSTAKTHIGRKTGAILAELGGAPVDQIKRLGIWNLDVADSTYLSKLPHGAIYALGGPNPDGQNYFLPRVVPVPPKLANKVFPEIYDW